MDFDFNIDFDNLHQKMIATMNNNDSVIPRLLKIKQIKKDSIIDCIMNNDYLLFIKKINKIDKYISYVFETACEYNIEMAKIIYNKVGSAKYVYSLAVAADTNCLAIIEWLIENNNTLDEREFEYQIIKLFINICYLKKIDIARYLYDVILEYKMKFDKYVELFIYACDKNNYELAKWLYEIAPNKKELIDNCYIKEIFKKLILDEQSDLLEWLCDKINFYKLDA